MDGDTLLNFVLVLFFVLLGGVFAGTELALVSLREGQIRQIERGGRRGARTAELARNPNRFLSAVQIGVTLSGFFSAAYGASTIAPDIEPVLESWGATAEIAEPVAFIGTTLLVAYLSLVLGELVPKRLAMQSALGFTRVLAPPLNLFAQLMRPVIWLLSVSTDALVRLLGGDPAVKTSTVTTEELWDMVAQNEALEEDSRRILTDVFGAGERRLQEVMHPRTEVSFIEAEMTLAQAREHTRQLPYSRYPVTGSSPDDVLGFIHIRDLISAEEDTAVKVGDIVRDILPLPGTNQVLPALTLMRRAGHHIALVVDEYGGTDGIVTLEDLVEELVGEIYDEYDASAGPEGRTLQAEGTVDADGGLVLQEFETLTGVALPDGRYETVAGYMIDRLGRMPTAGDKVQVDGHLLTVLSMDRLRIGRLRVTDLPDNEQGSH